MRRVERTGLKVAQQQLIVEFAISFRLLERNAVARIVGKAHAVAVCLNTTVARAIGIHHIRFNSREKPAGRIALPYIGINTLIELMVLHESALNAVYRLAVFRVRLTPDGVSNAGGGHEVAFIRTVKKHLRGKALSAFSADGNDTPILLLHSFAAPVETLIAVKNDCVIPYPEIQHLPRRARLKRPHRILTTLPARPSARLVFAALLELPRRILFIMRLDILVELSGDAAERTLVADIGLSKSAGSEPADVRRRLDHNRLKSHLPRLNRRRYSGGRSSIDHDILFVARPCPASLFDKIASLQQFCAVLLSVAAGPRRHEKALHALRGNVFFCELYDYVEILRYLVVGRTRNLVVLRLFKLKEAERASPRLRPVAFGDLLVVAHHILQEEIVPVGLHDTMRHLLKELLVMLPVDITPEPRLRPMLLDLLHREEEVVPPQVALTHNGKTASLLRSNLLLVPAKMKETRLAEYLAHIADHIRADLVVFRSGDLTRILLEPCVMRRRKVQFGNRLNSQSSQTGKFRLHLLRRPATFHGEFRMARIHHSLTKINEKKVHPLLRGVLCHLVPKLLVRAVEVAGVPVPLLFRLRLPDKRFFAPHVVSELHHQPPHHLPVTMRRRRRTESRNNRQHRHHGC